MNAAMKNATPLVLVGAGKMGGAMLAGWLDQGIEAAGVTIIDPSPPEEMLALIAKHGLNHFTTPPDGLTAAVIVVAVKPQIVAGVLPGLEGLVGADTVSLSIVAGTRLSTLSESLGGGAVVRAMPNTPAQVGRGVTVCCGDDKLSSGQQQLISDLLTTIGKVGWVEEEALIDAVTAVSGSGPAYVFLLAECMAEAGRKAGLPDDLAMLLARETVSGAGELLFQSDLDAATLRKNVTSPGGTTQAALEVLMADPGMQAIFDAAIAAAANRSRELA